MKKLMIAAASAAMIGGAFADGVAQVYDFTATVKTTQCSGKSAKDVCGDTVVYRTQITQKLYGKFWGCGCDVIACPDGYAKDAQDSQGFVFWTTTKAGGAFAAADMEWSVLQRLGKKGENVEGYFTLSLSDATDEVAALAGAGYGTAKIVCDDETQNYIKTMSGNLVGFWNTSADAIASGCYYCGDTVDCTVFAFCSCVSEQSDLAAVFGSFTLKYNASQTKAVNGGKSISEVAFKKNAAVLAVLNTEDKDDDDTDDAKTKLEKNYKAAKADYVDLAKGATQCTKGVELATAATDAETAYTTAKAATDAAAAAIDTKATGASDYKAAAKNLYDLQNTATATASQIAAAEEVLVSAKDNIQGDKVTEVVAKVDAWLAALKAEASAKTAKNEADAAVTAWTDSGYAAALAAAKEKADSLKIACLVAGGDCE